MKNHLHYYEVQKLGPHVSEAYVYCALAFLTNDQIKVTDKDFAFGVDLNINVEGLFTEMFPG